MINRHVYDDVLEAINETPAVGPLWPHQAEKTALAMEVGNTRP